MTTLINLTPHSINLMDGDNNPVQTIESSGVARCATNKKTVSHINGIPVNSTTFGQVENLPAPADDTVYIVSRLVLSACPDRQDLVVPDDLVRDSQGRIIGCRAFGV